MKVFKKDLWRAIKAFCYECNGGTTRIDCKSASCPLYTFGLPNCELKPVQWWKEPRTEWERASQEARGRVFKQPEKPEEDLPTITFRRFFS